VSPSLTRTFSALIRNLKDRKLLDKTVVLCTGDSAVPRKSTLPEVATTGPTLQAVSHSRAEHSVTAVPSAPPIRRP